MNFGLIEMNPVRGERALSMVLMPQSQISVQGRMVNCPGASNNSVYLCCTGIKCFYVKSLINRR
jgi:hypothetical protein